MNKIINIKNYKNKIFKLGLKFKTCDTYNIKNCPNLERVEINKYVKTNIFFPIDNNINSLSIFNLGTLFLNDNKKLYHIFFKDSENLILHLDNGYERITEYYKIEGKTAKFEKEEKKLHNVKNSLDDNIFVVPNEYTEIEIESTNCDLNTLDFTNIEGVDINCDITNKINKIILPTPGKQIVNIYFDKGLTPGTRESKFLSTIVIDNKEFDFIRDKSLLYIKSVDDLYFIAYKDIVNNNEKCMIVDKNLNVEELGNLNNLGYLSLRDIDIEMIECKRARLIQEKEKNEENKFKKLVDEYRTLLGNDFAYKMLDENLDNVKKLTKKK